MIKNQASFKSGPASTTFSDESAHRPFPSKSKNVNKLMHNEGIRMRDKEMQIGRIQQQKQQQHRSSQPNYWPSELDEVLESLGLADLLENESKMGQNPLWWQPPSPSDHHQGPGIQNKGSDRRLPKSDRFEILSDASKGRQTFRHSEAPPPSLTDHMQQKLAANQPLRGGGRNTKTIKGSRPSSQQTNLASDDSLKAFISSSNGISDGSPSSTIYDPSGDSDETLALLLPLLILLSTLVLLLLTFVIMVIFVRRRARIALTDGDGPLDVGREEELEGLGGLDGVEERWLETIDDATRRGYLRAKDWSLSSPPGSHSSDITLSQFLSIQEKGVSAWSFDPDYEINPSVYVAGRTEISFLADGEGMAPQEGGGCSVQSNLPLPKLNEVYYWEAKIFTKPEATNISVGLATKPYPSFRMPGWSKFSVGYFSVDGFKCHNYPFAAQSYGPAYVQGDVIGIGFRPRSGTVFFTRNGKKLEDAFVGLHRYNLFPTIAADGAAEVHVNLGQAGFVFIEANVKKWGLAPMVGTLAPPPPYGQERGSILIETGQSTSSEADQRGGHGNGSNIAYLHPPRNVTPPPPLTPPNERVEDQVQSSSPASSLSRRARARRNLQNISTLPHSITTGQSNYSDDYSPSSNLEDEEAETNLVVPRRDSLSSNDEPHNPPTPHHLDISLHSLDALPIINGDEEAGARSSSSSTTLRGRRHPHGNANSYFPFIFSSSGNGTANRIRSRSASPPPYSDIRSGWPGDSGALGGTSASNGQARRSSGRTHSLANALLGALADRGLLTPLSAHDGQFNGNNNDGSQMASYERVIHPSSTQGHSDQNDQSWLASWFR